MAVRRLRNRQKQIYDYMLDKNKKTTLQTKQYYDIKTAIRDHKYAIGQTVLLRNFNNVDNVPKSLKSTFGSTKYTVESRHGVTYWLKNAEKPDAPLKVAHHNQIRSFETKTDEVRDRINLRDRQLKPARLGYPLEENDNQL